MDRRHSVMDEISYFYKKVRRMLHIMVVLFLVVNISAICFENTFEYAMECYYANGKGNGISKSMVSYLSGKCIVLN